jgi:hypothetical protein
MLLQRNHRELNFARAKQIEAGEKSRKGPERVARRLNRFYLKTE